jgi:hypothetical protein
MDGETVQPALKELPSIALSVIHPFGDYQRGDRITDAATIAAILDGESHRNVNKVGA